MKRIGAAIALALSIATPAAAYILPAEAILSSVARRREQLGFKSLVIEGLRRRGGAGTAEERVWEAVLPEDRDPRPGRRHQRDPHRGQSPLDLPRR
jgi:hypothetical protein